MEWKRPIVSLSNFYYPINLTVSESDWNDNIANQYDTIVIGYGISGGWAAKELTKKGLKTLLLERGRPVEHVKDYPATMSSLWGITHRGRYPVGYCKKARYRLKWPMPSMNIPGSFLSATPTTPTSR